jgi:hypothetical protein
VASAPTLPPTALTKDLRSMGIAAGDGARRRPRVRGRAPGAWAVSGAAVGGVRAIA